MTRVSLLRRTATYAAGCLLALLAVTAAWPGSAAAQKSGAKRPELVDFKVEVVQPDPFDLSHKVGAKPAAVPRVRRGDRVRLVITGEPKAGYYTYGIEQGDDSPVSASVTLPTYS